MSSKANVTTPGGFFVGLGGIVSFCVVAAAVACWVKSHANSDELRPQQIALGLRAADSAPGAEVATKNADRQTLLDQAAKKYNGGAQPNLDKLDDLRGVIRFREAQKLKAEADKALTGAVAWKDKAKGEVTMPISLAMQFVADGLANRKPKASAVKVDVMPAADPNAAPTMPNAMGGGAKTVIFPNPNAVAAPATTVTPAPTTVSPAPTSVTTPPLAVPPAAPAPATNPAPAPAPANGAAVAVPAPIVASVPAPARPTLLNWPESKK